MARRNCFLISCIAAAFCFGGCTRKPTAVEFINLVAEDEATASEVLTRWPDLANESTDGGKTGLYVAATHGRRKLAEMLLEHGADPNDAVVSTGWTALHASVIPVPRKFIEEYSVPIPTVDRLDFRSEIGKDKLAIFQALIETGADVNGMVSNIAAMYGHDEMVRILIDAGTDVDGINKTSGATSVFSAASMGWPTIVKMLIDAGADVRKENKQGATPLFAASDMRPIFQVPQYGFSEDDIWASDDIDPTSDVSRRKREVARLLIAQNSDVNAKGPHGVTPIQNAAARGDVELIKMLVEAGADLHHVSDVGMTALDFAARFDQTGALEYLESIGGKTANPEVPARLP